MKFYSLGKNLLFLLIAFNLTLFLCLVVLEISLRQFISVGVEPGYRKTHPTRRYELKPYFVGKTYDANLSINSYGLRDFERPISKGDDAYRIAILGDSITFGIGVEMEQTFPKILEKKLNDYMKIPAQVFL